MLREQQNLSSRDRPVTTENIHFVTGKLAEPALRNVLTSVAAKAGFKYSVQVLPITVAALMTPAWIAKRIEVPPAATKIILPGYCDGDLSDIQAVTNLPLEVGPKDLRRLPEHFNQTADRTNYGRWDIEIIAEINHAPRLSLSTILDQADAMRTSGATLIDVGCDPKSNWSGVADCVKALKDAGHRVSIDSLNPQEIARAVAAGAELVLSVNESNRDAAADWGCEIVVIPDDIRDINSMQPTIELLASQNVSMRLDPILEPIGMGFAASLGRYMAARKRWPDAEMMMGVGNLTELTDVDSAGINVLLLAICQELGIRSVLTTQVINWARSCVRELDIARRMVHYAVTENVPPKHLTEQLVCLRDARTMAYSPDQIKELAAQIKDNNYRILAEQDEIHLMGSGKHFHNADPFVAFDELAATNPGNLDASHAFYLGYEMCKAMTALQLGKQYTQDEALNWGHLTQPEVDRHRLKKRRDRS